MRNNLKIGLALGSGGARGFCHVGILQAFEEAGLLPDVITGCSMGAIAAATYASGIDLKEIEKLSLKIRQNVLTDYSNPFFAMGFAKGDRSIQLLKRYIGDIRFRELRIPAAVTATDLVKGELVTIKSGLVWRAVRASYSLPIIFKPIRMGNRLLVDGGVIERIPVKACRDLGADIVIAVDAIGPVRPYNVKNSILSVAERTYLLFDEGVFKNLRNESDFLIVPEMDKTIFAFNSNEEPIEAGRKAAQEALPKIFELIDSWDGSGKKSSAINS